MKKISLTLEELEEVLKGNEMSSMKFSAKLTQIRREKRKNSPNLVGEYQKSFTKEDQKRISDEENKIINIQDLRDAKNN